MLRTPNADVDGTQPQTLHFPADDLQTADRSFNTPVGIKPHQGHQNVDRVRNPCIKEREQDAVRRLSWPDAETKLVRRQGAAGPHLEDGQPIFAETARRPDMTMPLLVAFARR